MFRVVGNDAVKISRSGSQALLLKLFLARDLRTSTFCRTIGLSCRDFSGQSHILLTPIWSWHVLRELSLLVYLLSTACSLLPVTQVLILSYILPPLADDVVCLVGAILGTSPKVYLKASGNFRLCFIFEKYRRNQSGYLSRNTNLELVPVTLNNVIFQKFD